MTMGWNPTNPWEFQGAIGTGAGDEEQFQAAQDASTVPEFEAFLELDAPGGSPPLPKTSVLDEIKAGGYSWLATALQNEALYEPFYDAAGFLMNPYADFETRFGDRFPPASMRGQNEQKLYDLAKKYYDEKTNIPDVKDIRNHTEEFYQKQGMGRRKEDWKNSNAYKEWEKIAPLYGAFERDKPSETKARSDWTNEQKELRRAYDEGQGFNPTYGSFDSKNRNKANIDSLNYSKESKKHFEKKFDEESGNIYIGSNNLTSEEFEELRRFSPELIPSFFEQGGKIIDAPKDNVKVEEVNPETLSTLASLLDSSYEMGGGYIEDLLFGGDRMGSFQLPDIPQSLVDALQNPYIMMEQTQQIPTGDPNNPFEETTTLVPMINPAIDVGLRIYQQRLESQIQVFRDKAQEKYDTEQGEIQRQNDIQRALIAATGGNVAVGDPNDGGYDPSDYQQFQREMARISGGVGFGGTTGTVPFSGDVQRALFPRTPAGQVVTTPRGLTPYEQQMADLYPTEVQAQLEQAQLAQNRQQFLEDLAVRQRMQELSELEAQARIRQIDEQNRQAQMRAISDQMLGLQQVGTSRGDIEQNRRLELARLLSDPRALATMSTLYGAGALPTGEDIFAQPFATPQSTGVPSAQTGGVPDLGIQAGGVDGKQTWIQNKAYELQATGAYPNFQEAILAAEHEWGGLGPQLQQQYMQPPSPSIPSVPMGTEGGNLTAGFTPYASPSITLTEPQFQELSPFAQGSYTAQRALTGEDPEEQARRRRDITPVGTTFAAPRMPVGINRYMTGEYNTL